MRQGTGPRRRGWTRSEAGPNPQLAFGYHKVQQGWLSVLKRSGYGLRLGRPGTATAIVVSYKRMFNLAAIVRSLLLCRFVERVVVSNNNPDVDLERWVPRDDPRLVLVQHDRRRPPSSRYDMARRYPADYYLAVDDDVFPNPWQLRRMLASLIREPAAPRGLYGEVYDEARGRLVKAWPRGRFGRWPPHRVDVVLQAYAFTGAHLRRYFELLELLGRRNEDIDSDDVVLSFSGTERPVAGDAGWVYQCPSWNRRGVAVWRQPGFLDSRHELYGELCAATGR